MKILFISSLVPRRVNKSKKQMAIQFNIYFTLPLTNKQCIVAYLSSFEISKAKQINTEFEKNKTTKKIVFL
jgi:hypothetical protein